MVKKNSWHNWHYLTVAWVWPLHTGVRIYESPVVIRSLISSFFGLIDSFIHFSRSANDGCLYVYDLEQNKRTLKVSICVPAAIGSVGIVNLYVFYENV